MRSTLSGQRFLLLLLAGSGILAFFILRPFFAPIVFAIVFAVVLQPVYKRISRLLGNWPSTAAVLTVLLAAICILLPLGFLGTQIALQAQGVYATFAEGDGQAQVQSIVLYMEQTVGAYIPGVQGFSDSLSANISAYGQQALQWIVEHIGPAVSGIASVFLSLFIFFIALYYLLRDGAVFRQEVVSLSPLPDAQDETVLHKLGLAVNSVITGSLMIGLIQGTLTAIGFTLFGVPNSILWGTVAAIAALIPAVGTALVIIPAIIFLFVTVGPGPALGLTGWAVLAVGMVDNFLGPRLMGRGIKLHPFFVLLSVLGGISFFGIMGIFLGPIFLSFLFALLSIYASLPKQQAEENAV